MTVDKDEPSPDPGPDRCDRDLLRQRFAIGAWAVAIPLVKALFGLSDATLSLVLFAAGAGAIAAMPLAGLLPSRIGGTGPTLRVTGPIFAALLAGLPLTHALAPGMGLLALCAFLFACLMCSSMCR